MSDIARYKFDVLVIGGGPAGMAAAVRASEGGVRVGLVDDNFRLGGQIWRHLSEADRLPEAVEWIRRLEASPTKILCGLRVFAQPETSLLLAESSDGLCELRYQKLILATGARERFLPFPGWTLPNVMGAGGLQAMVKGGLVIQDKRVVVAGTGPLLLAVAAYLRKHGAEIALICEQAPWKKLVGFGIALFGQHGKITQGLRLRRELAGVPLAFGSWPIAAQGKNALKSVTIFRRGKSETLACDYLACGFHLVPNTELAALLGCRIQNGFVSVDHLQTTTVPGVFCAGEPTAIGGVELAIVEGEIAGFSAANRTAEARHLMAAREKLRKFAVSLSVAFELRPELRNLPDKDTLVCRCEDVAYARLLPYSSWRSSKLQTRCGMGACQGRICGPAAQFLFNWNPESVRPPIFPARVESLAVPPGFPQSQHQEVIGGLG